MSRKYQVEVVECGKNTCNHKWEYQTRPWCDSFWMCTECEMELSENQYDALKQAIAATAERCREIATAQMLAPRGAWGKGATFNAEKIARLIKEEYELSD